MQPRKLKITIVPCIGALIAILGATLAICWDEIFLKILAQQLVLTTSSKSYEVWRKTPMTMAFDVYFFNWTNPEDFLNHSTKPFFEELGPYRFRETREKVNITWNAENSTVSYRVKRDWYFDEENSIGNLNDSITTLNVIAASAVYTERFQSYMRKKTVSIGLSMYHQEISVTKTAGELLFDGYQDPLLDIANSLPQLATSAPKIDKFGWFYKRNGSIENDGYFNMDTGVSDINSFGKLLNWNYAPRTPYYAGKCGEISGSAGEFFPPELMDVDQISLFSSDLCRTIAFDFEEFISVHGVIGKKFTGGSSIVDNGTEIDENACFCPGECQPSGTVNVSACRFGSPAFVSFPHFYLADQYYLDSVEGMEPDKDKHSFYLALEPTSSIPLEVAARFQLNILVSPSEHIKLYKKVPRVFMPILWFEQRVTMDKETAEQIKLMLKVPTIGTVGFLIVFVVGIAIMLYRPLKTNIRVCLKSKRKRSDSLSKNKVVMNNMVSKEMVSMLPDTEDEEKKLGTVEEEALNSPRRSIESLKNDIK